MPGHQHYLLGTVVQPYGKIGAVLFLSGERYYHLIDEHGNVAMMPAQMIEQMYRKPLRVRVTRG